MENPSDSAVSPNRDDVIRLSCLEVWGGNRQVHHAVELPGLEGWVHSEPTEEASSGGDVHYLSVCSKGILSRFTLADVSGHGESSSAVAQILQKLINKYIDTWDQSQLMRDLNDSLQMKRGEHLQYATAAFFAYLRPKRELVFTIAGHPPNALVPRADSDLALARARPAKLAIGRRTAFQDSFREPSMCKLQ